MKNVDEERVVLEEVVHLQTAAVADPEIGKKFAVVGCEEADRMGNYTQARVFKLCSFTYLNL